MSIEPTTPQTADITYYSYITLLNAENYFLGRFNSDAWNSASADDKQTVLVQATRLIDCLNYEGVKTDDSQATEFPRDGGTVVPIEISIATCEIAFSLLDGVDPEQELNSLATSSQGYGSVRETYDRTQSVEHFRAGIPSAVAWAYLKPFLHDPAQINLSRV